MKIKTKKIISLTLAIMLVFSCVGTAAYGATAETVVQYGKAGGYLAIGDSIGRGCGSDGFYLDRDIAPDGGQYDIYELRNVVGSYTTLVSQAVGCKAPDDMTDQDATFWPCCYPGMTTAVALDLYGIDDNYSDTKLNYSYYKDALDYFGYEGSSVGAKGETYVAGEDGKCSSIIDATEKADLITVELGMCDIFYRAYRIISNGGFLKDGLSFDVSSISAIGDLLTDVIDLLKEGYQLWEEKYPKLIERIIEINPDATVVMVGSFNLVNEMTLMDNMSFPLGSIFSGITDSMNKQYEKWAEEYNILYADVTNTETLATEKGWSVLGDFLKDNNSFAGSHPSQNGHDYMARQVLSVLPEKEETKNISVDIGRYSEANDFEYILVNGIDVKNKTEIKGHQLTVNYSGPLATSLTIGIKNDDGTTAVQAYKLSYNSDTGYSAYRVGGTNDIAGALARPFKLIAELFQMVIDALKGLFNK